ncbi:MAG: TRC40/GET3/ArsA family transport-energizing ATPase [Leptolyngbyaceae cyanobacterium SM1_3_5]|nr:TRC40/GET3/ArsA family transport-energizing ATPase [Leptolyngbyaceae cyanobacterium SM1_3_5]
MFSGKGGVGKTTLSCGFARRWAQQFPAEQILLLSTDPAHSLGDVLQESVTDEARSLPDLPNLQVRSLNAEKLLQAFKAEHGAVLELLIERGSFVQSQDLAPIWDLSWPGVDELMSLLEIQRLLRDQQVDRIVVDTAPTGHTLNLFKLMDFLDNFLEALNLFQAKHREMGERFAGRHVQDQADRFLVMMQQDLSAGRSLLQSAQTNCLMVAIAEPLSLLETERLQTALTQLGIAIGGLFVNQLRPDAPQQDLLTKWIMSAPDLPLLGIPQQAIEPVGMAALDRLMTQIQPIQSAQPTFTTATVKLPEKLAPSLSDFLAEGRQLLIVGGKGGVGKTTVAAAIAWALAERHPDQQVRVISIDPAHSLGDAFSMAIGHEPVAISPNLSAQEIDSDRLLDQFRADYLWELADMMSGNAEDDNLQVAYGPQAWRQIAGQALPGIDEMLALLSIIHLLETNAQDLIVLDTAPTGHLLRFLEMPTALADWLGWIFKLWLKYQNVVGRTELMERLRSLRQQVVRSQRHLKNAQHTEFLSVFRAKSAILAETERLAQALDDLNISQRYWIQNCYEAGQTADNRTKTIVRLPLLPAIAPIDQVKAAADLLF